MPAIQAQGDSTKFPGLVTLGFIGSSGLGGASSTRFCRLTSDFDVGIWWRAPVGWRIRCTVGLTISPGAGLSVST